MSKSQPTHFTVFCHWISTNLRISLLTQQNHLDIDDRDGSSGVGEALWMLWDIERMLHLPNLKNKIDVKSIYYHISLRLGRLEPNQFIILSCFALLWHCFGKALSWAWAKAVLHGSCFCHICPCSVSNHSPAAPAWICPGPALHRSWHCPAFPVFNRTTRFSLRRQSP